ncbi:hypothetical protein R5R35_005159 [Gryllus longicercus]|uniref:Protein quiver n=1 Tax=Gryllus longicercus TaxID=2509291 RepID=A0AAN9VBC6_9ORTH
MNNMMRLHKFIYLCLISFLAVFCGTASGISCYQCLSTDHENPFQCNEFMTDADITPQSCDNIYNAQYCVKHTGRYEAQSLECYQCSTPFDIRCSDLLIHDETLHPTNCNDIYGAEYCIKTTGIFGGGLGTKRFCSPLDLGNYCNYIQQPGDELEYRSCVYTCSTDGCNPASVSEPKFFLLFVTISLVVTNIALPWLR